LTVAIKLLKNNIISSPQWILFSLVIPIFLILPTAFGQDTNSVELLPMGDKPYGLNYEDHVINYQKYILSIPLDKSPGSDTTGELCTYGQDAANSTIFYLNGNPGGEVTRTCTIPSGLGLFIPIITVEFSTAEAPNTTVEELHRLAKNDQDNVKTLSLKINDKEFSYDELKKYRTHTRDFQVTFPENAIFGAKPGPSTAVADGFHVFTTPLSPGNYTVSFGGSLVCLGVDCTEPIFATKNTYKLTVK
jgi:hypothetical protein